MILAPLRGVTIKCFRRIFADQIKAAGFKEAFTPFISAMPGVDPLRDRELTDAEDAGIEITPQFIGKDPEALRNCLGKIKKAGYVAADLNCGCPFPMIRNKGRVLSRSQIIEHVWSYDYEGASNMVDVYIRSLRKKIDEAGTSLEEATKRNNLIQKKLKNIDAAESITADSILGITED